MPEDTTQEALDASAAATPSEDGQVASQDAQEASADGPGAPPDIPHRFTVPPAPKVDTEQGKESVDRMRAYMQAAVYGINPAVIDVAIENISNVSMRGMSPDVQVYKAECLDYLKGKAKRAADISARM